MQSFKNLELKPFETIKLFYIRFGATFLKIRPQIAFYGQYLKFDLAKKILLVLSITVFQGHTPYCLSLLFLQQIAIILFYQMKKLEKVEVKNILAIFGEIQLAVTICLVAYIYVKDLQAEQNPGSDSIPQSYVQTKIVIGWLVIAIFLLQTLTMCINSFITIFLIFLKNCQAIFTNPIYARLRYAESFKCLIQLKFALMQHFPGAFPLTSSHSQFRPIKEKVKLLQNLLDMNR